MEALQKLGQTQRDLQRITRDIVLRKPVSLSEFTCILQKPSAYCHAFTATVFAADDLENEHHGTFLMLVKSGQLEDHLKNQDADETVRLQIGILWILR